MKTVSMGKLSALVFREAGLRGQLTAAGGNSDTVRESIGRNPRFFRRQAIVVQVSGVLFAFSMIMWPVVAIRGLGSDTSSSWNLLIATALMTGFHLFQFGIILSTVLTASEILDDELFLWPRTLPIATSGVTRLRLLSLVRGNFMPLCGAAVAYPVAVAVASGSVAAAGVALGTSAVNLPLTLSLVVLAAQRLRRSLRGHGGPSWRAQAARVLTMLTYGAGTFLGVALMQIVMSLLSRLYDSPQLAPLAARQLLLALSWLPLPSAPSALTVLLAGSGLHGAANELLSPAAVGSVGYLMVAALLIWAAFRIIGREGGGAAAARFNSARVLGAFRVTTPRRAFRRQLWLATTREMPSMMLLIVPVLTPALCLVSASMMATPPGVMIYVAALVAAVFNPWIMALALTRQEPGAGQLAATRPIRERDRVFPRLVLSAIVASAGALVADLVVLRGKDLWVGLALGTIPAVAAPLGMLVKMVLFGRLRGRVVLDEVRPGSRRRKWATIMTTITGTAALLIGIRWILVSATSFPVGSVAFLAVVAGAVCALWVGACRVFP